MLPKNSHGCPTLILAPMEGVADRAFRIAMSKVGGFDEACTEFLRVPRNAHVASLAKRYEADELGEIPIAAQIMGGEPHLMAAMTRELIQRGAKRIDLNCGCPSNTVTGRGAGSSLLKDPRHLYDVAKAMVQASSVPVTAKLRSGFADTSLFKENLLAAQESGIAYLTLHPRTKIEGYTPPARWELIAQAKELLLIPVVGNGDINSVEDALAMLKMTGCDALMIGRGSLMNPWIFHEIKGYFSAEEAPSSDLAAFLQHFIQAFPEEMRLKTQINKLKQLGSYLFRHSSKREEMLRGKYDHPESFLEFAKSC